MELRIYVNLFITVTDASQPSLLPRWLILRRLDGWWWETEWPDSGIKCLLILVLYYHYNYTDAQFSLLVYAYTRILICELTRLIDNSSREM